jgi:hypothetical protein
MALVDPYLILKLSIIMVYEFQIIAIKNWKKKGNVKTFPGLFTLV